MLMRVHMHNIASTVHIVCIMYMYDIHRGIPESSNVKVMIIQYSVHYSV